MTLPKTLRDLALLTFAVTSTAFAAVDPAQVNDARALFDQRKDAEAQAAFTTIAADDPRCAEAHFYLGVLALRRNEPEAAVPFFKMATELDPKSISYQLRLGDAYGMSAGKAGLFSKLGLAKKCRTQYEKAVALDPNSVEARWSLMEYYKQAPGFAGGSYDRALEQANEIVKFNPSAGRFARAGVWVAQKKLKEAFAPYKDVLAADPPDYAALNQLAQLTLWTGQNRAGGIEAFKKCLALPTPPYEPGHALIQLWIGQLHEGLGDKAAAREAYRATLALDPNFQAATDALRKLN